MSCCNKEITKSDDQCEMNENEAQSLTNTELNDDNVAETSTKKDDSSQPADKEIKYKTVELEVDVSDSKTLANMSSVVDIPRESEQLNELNVAEVPIEKVDKAVPESKEPKVNSNAHTASNIEIPEASSTSSEILIQDMSILNINEKNNRNRNSSVVLNKQTDSLRNLMLYDSTTDNESEDSDFEKDWQLHVLNNPDTGSSEDSESDSNESLGSSDGSSIIDIEKEL